MKAWERRFLVYLVSVRDFLKLLSCLFPELNGFFNRMKSLTYLKAILCLKEISSKMEGLPERKLLHNQFLASWSALQHTTCDPASVNNTLTGGETDHRSVIFKESSGL